MASFRFIFAVVAVAVYASQASALAISASTPEVSVSVDGSINKLQNQVTAIAANQGVNGNSIQNGINKLKELIGKIEKNVVSAEGELKGALQSATVKVAETINNAINASTGINLDLVQNWEDLEEKVLDCANSVNPELQTLVANILDTGKSCASKQIAAGLVIKEQLANFTLLLDTVPSKTLVNIKSCSGSSDESSSDESDDSDDDAATLLPGEITLNALNIRALPSFATIKCVSKELLNAAIELRSVPKDVYQLVKEIRELASEESQKTLQACAATALVGSETRLQEAAADLAQCIIAPVTVTVTTAPASEESSEDSSED